MLEILTFPLGPLSTNAYLLADPAAGEAVVVDPGWDGSAIAAAARERGWTLRQAWLTHAHFDHFGGLAGLAEALGNPDLPVALHAADLPLWEQGGLGKGLGYDLPPGPRPSIDLARTASLSVGAYPFQVRHAPGHTPGLCIFYCAQAQVLLSGDLIFREGVGRTDLPGGDWDALVESIQAQVYSLPEATRVLPGHGDETTVGDEKFGNPFVRS
jgi:glyoxylase-like metal-dependent hydrolase (beta-lactamase superfamily II)